MVPLSLTSPFKLESCLIFFLSESLKVSKFIYFQWECSSAGEHMTEDYGVGGSTPPIPIYTIFRLYWMLDKEILILRKIMRKKPWCLRGSISRIP